MVYKYNILKKDNTDKAIRTLFGDIKKPDKNLNFWVRDRFGEYHIRDFACNKITDSDDFDFLIPSKDYKANIIIQVEFDAPDDYKPGDKLFIPEWKKFIKDIEDEDVYSSNGHWIYAGDGLAFYSCVFPDQDEHDAIIIENSFNLLFLK